MGQEQRRSLLLFLGRGRGIFRPGEEDRDLRLHESLAILSVADLGVEGLHAGAKVGSHYEVDAELYLCALGALRNGPTLVALAREVVGSDE